MPFRGFTRLFRLCCVVILLWGASGIAHCATLRVPGEYPTLQAAIDAAVDGDIVLIADGTYSGIGFYYVDLRGKAITVTSEHGPDHTIIDIDDNGAGFEFYQNETRTTVLNGLTITGAWEGWGGGGGANVYYASPTFSNCVFTDNQSVEDIGGGVGGAVACFHSSPLFVGCTITGNSARGNPPSPWDGGGVYAYSSPGLEFERCIIWGNCRGDIVLSDGTSTATLTCCLLDSAGLGGSGTFVFQGESVFGNPLFCTGLPCPNASRDPTEYRLDASSPCLPPNNLCGQLMGALGVGCPPAEAPLSSLASGASPAVRLLGPWPNPTTGRLVYGLASERRTHARVSVVDMTGRLVCLLMDGPVGIGEQHRACELLRDHGRPLCSGVYTLVLRADGRSEGRRVLYVK